MAIQGKNIKIHIGSEILPAKCVSSFEQDIDPVQREIERLKSCNHDHFFIRKEQLFEVSKHPAPEGVNIGSFTYVMNVKGMPNVEKCDNSCMKYIVKEYIQK